MQVRGICSLRRPTRAYSFRRVLSAARRPLRSELAKLSHKEKPWLGQLLPATQAKASFWLAEARAAKVTLPLRKDVAFFAVLAHVEAFHLLFRRNPQTNDRIDDLEEDE